MTKIICEGCGDFGCEGPVHNVVVSRIGVLNLCESAMGRYEDAGYVVSSIYAGAYFPAYVDVDKQRAEPDEEILRALGHYLKEN